jgi:hypothetical protein
MPSKKSACVVGAIVAAVALALLPARLPARADQSSRVELSTGRWQVTYLQKRMTAPDKSKPDINDVDTVLIDTQSGETWVRELRPGGFYWARMRKE